MIFRTFIAPAFALMSALQPVGAVQQVPNGFSYINAANDGSLYFGKRVAKAGTHAFMQMFEIEPDGSVDQWTATFDCSNNTFEVGPNEWEPLDPNSVGQQWFNAACK